jgi:hypothetical protein
LLEILERAPCRAAGATKPPSWSWLAHVEPGPPQRLSVVRLQFLRVEKVWHDERERQ